MHCPNDQVLLQAEQSDVHACRRCRSRVFVGEAFSEIYPGVRELLAPDDRGGRGRRSACPQCSALMQPMRLGRLLAWLDACDACQLLWVEKLNENVVRGLRERWKRDFATSSLPRRDRAELARGVVAGVAEGQQEHRRIKLLSDQASSFDPFDMGGELSALDWIGDLLDFLID